MASDESELADAVEVGNASGVTGSAPADGAIDVSATTASASSGSGGLRKSGEWGFTKDGRLRDPKGRLVARKRELEMMAAHGVIRPVVETVSPSVDSPPATVDAGVGDLDSVIEVVTPVEESAAGPDVAQAPSGADSVDSESGDANSPPRDRRRRVKKSGSLAGVVTEESDRDPCQWQRMGR